MELNLVQSLMLGLISGLTEPLPVSADAHRGLVCYFCGVDSAGPLFELLCGVAVLVVLLATGRLELLRLYRCRRLQRQSARRRAHDPELNSVNTLKLLRSAGLIVVVGQLLGTYISGLAGKLYLLPVPLALCGLVLLLPSHFRSGNKDARNLSAADGILLGLAAAAGAVPGVSAVGMCMSAAAIRGVDRRYALRFAWMLLVLALMTRIGVDLLAVIGAGADFGWMELLFCMAGAASAAAGSWLAVKLMHALVKSGSIMNFCFYSWGMALLCLVLYLFV